MVVRTKDTLMATGGGILLPDQVCVCMYAFLSVFILGYIGLMLVLFRIYIVCCQFRVESQPIPSTHINIYIPNIYNHPRAKNDPQKDQS